jgi:hypothetical protein
MNAHQLVCPFDKELLAQLPGRAVVVYSDNITMLPDIEPYLADKHQLQEILLTIEQPLSAILPLPAWGHAHLTLYVSELGLFRDVDPYIKQLRAANLKIFMPAATPENFAGLRILSSLGITSGLLFDGQMPDWERVSDLMHYAVYGKYPHAPIEPFYFVTRHYQPTAQLDFGAVYFDDPTKYLHVSKEGYIASNRRNLMGNYFMSEDLADLENIVENSRYQEALQEWRRFFLQNDGCAYCGAWRVCMGRFADHAADGTCEKLFSDLMEAAEFVRSQQTEPKR